MPKASPRVCTRPGCGRLIPFGGVCPAHPVKDGSFADRRRGSRQSRGYDADWDRVRALVIERDAGLCQPCLRGETFVPPFATRPSVVRRFEAVDHIVSKAEAKRRGWTRTEADDPANLQCICGSCHTAKTALESLTARTRGSQAPS